MKRSFWRCMQHKFEIWGLKENKSIHPYITKLSYVRVEGTYDCIHIRLNARSHSWARWSSGDLQADTAIAPSKRRQHVTQWVYYQRRLQLSDSTGHLLICTGPRAPNLFICGSWTTEKEAKISVYTYMAHRQRRARQLWDDCTRDHTPSRHRQDGECIIIRGL